MKEAYAVRRTVPPSAEIEDQIDELLAVGVGENPRESLSGLAKLGARLIIQRSPLRETPIRPGETLTTRSPAANSACSGRRETCRQFSSAHTRSSSRPRAHRTAARCPGSSALISRLA